MRGVASGRFGSAGAGEGEFDEQHGDEAEDGKEDEDQHGAADAIPEAVLALMCDGMREEIQVEIQRDADGEQADGDASYASDEADDRSGNQVIEEHLLQE